MTDFPSVLDKADVSMVRHEPFPHIIVDDALPQDVYDQLAQSYPDPMNLPEKMRTRNNHRYNLLSKWGAAEFSFDAAAPEWQAFLNRHDSPEFVEEVFNLFPDFTEDSDSGKQFNVNALGPNLSGKIGVDDFVNARDVKARSTVGINTPVTEVSSVRGAHTDSIRKAYVGLLYFRHENDDSTGGDLEIFNWKDDASRSEWPVSVDRDLLNLVNTIEYRPNRYVLFLTTSDALHGVSPRSVTSTFRRLVVTSGWLPGVDHYDTDTTHGLLRRLKATVMSKIRRALGRAQG
ncbi:2OG-Fe(II) oxygenase [Amylibacter sp. IMCC11727]|uniref:2OG-Fe(II) oxygenase n=1 Tax=Amylibacter sp. IMCC11727 TaxID=3039851 RepID=UPI00244E2F3B|nr:2OG-Fe(II) oxygenase [Amylibacter sp. IMCC11727]WGI21823.1 2OG-Fe(II) oxygenase [Amylibacter sp. IMCC11727]